MLKDFELILKELNKGFERKELEIMLIKFDLERAKKEADDYAIKCEELEQKVAELEAEITRLTTTQITVDDVAYEMEGAE